MNVINVKKNKNEVHGIRFIVLIFIITSLVICFYVNFNYLIVLTLGALVCVPALVLLLYYEVWKVSFFSEKICFVSLFCKKKEYKYAQIRDVVKGYSYTERFYIMITFTDGKCVRFRQEDENAQKAIATIISHRPIRNEW